MRRPLRHIILESLLVACLSSGCSCPAQLLAPALTSERNGSAPGRSAGAASLADVLPEVGDRPLAELRAELETIIAARPPADLARQEASYVLARLLQKGGSGPELTEALPLFAQASQIAALWERCQWHISEAAASIGQEQTARQALLAVIEKQQEEAKRSSGPSQTLSAAQYALAQSYLRANETDKARSALLSIRHSYPDSQFALGAAYYLAEMKIDSPPDRAEGLALFRAYLKASPDGRFARQIVGRLSSLADYQPSAEDSDLTGAVHFLAGEYAQALADWSRAGPASAGRWFEAAICQLRLGRTAQAKAALLSGITAHPQDRSLPVAARTLCTLLSRDEAFSLWNTVLRISTRYGDLALWNLAIRSSQQQALYYYRQIMEKHPHSSFAAEASWWLFWNLVKEGKTAQAQAQAQSCLKKYPGTRAQARFAFWSGKLAERLNKPEIAKAAYAQAAQHFPANYYGHRAVARLCKLAGGADPGWAVRPGRKHPNPGWSWPEPPVLFSFAEIGKRYGPTAEILSRLRQWDECLSLLPEKVDPYYRSYLLAMVGEPRNAINTCSQALSGRPNNGARWQIAYPLLYAREIAGDSPAQLLDPLLVHALVREESRYNQLAVSRSNALGLMQLLPGTAYGVAKRIGLSLGSQSDILRPENNLAMGKAYIAYVMKRANGQAMLAVASYNGGPNAVKEWDRHFRESGLRDYDYFLEDIPFPETRDYVRKVFGSFWNYEDIYAPTQPLSKKGTAKSPAKMSAGKRP